MTHFYQPLVAELEPVVTPVKRALGIINPVIESLQYSPFDAYDLSVKMLRLDAVHPVVSGNKWYKLKFNIGQALQQKASSIITFGGAWSNHLHAFSYVGHQLGIKTIAVVRGGEWQHQSNPMLQDLEAWGTDIITVDRSTYRQRNELAYQASLAKQFPGSYVIPEGGDNFLGMMGVVSLFADLVKADAQILAGAETIALGCGTGNTFVGTRLALPAKQRVLGFSVLKGEWYHSMLAQKLASYWPLLLANWQVMTQFHGGGFGKINSAIQSWATEFETQTNVLLDPVYTAKLLYGIECLAQGGFFPKAHRLLVIHTGGIQGRRSLLLNS